MRKRIVSIGGIKYWAAGLVGLTDAGLSWIKVEASADACREQTSQSRGLADCRRDRAPTKANTLLGRFQVRLWSLGEPSPARALAPPEAPFTVTVSHGGSLTLSLWFPVTFRI